MRHDRRSLLPWQAWRQLGLLGLMMATTGLAACDGRRHGTGVQGVWQDMYGNLVILNADSSWWESQEGKVYSPASYVVSGDSLTLLRRDMGPTERFGLGKSGDSLILTQGDRRRSYKNVAIDPRKILGNLMDCPRQTGLWVTYGMLSESQGYGNKALEIYAPVTNFFIKHMSDKRSSNTAYQQVKNFDGSVSRWLMYGLSVACQNGSLGPGSDESGAPLPDRGGLVEGGGDYMTYDGDTYRPLPMDKLYLVLHANENIIYLMNQ